MVFASYAHDDRERVEPLVNALAVRFNVWWDQDIKLGHIWRQTLMEKLDSARCVLVAWTVASVSARHDFIWSELDRALRAVFIERYDRLYELGRQIFQEFKSQTSAKPQMAKKDVFIERVVAGEQLEGIPPLDDEAAIREFVLPRIVDNKDQKEVIEALAK